LIYFPLHLLDILQCGKLARNETQNHVLVLW
jgi:hypothetical protein